MTSFPKFGGVMVSFSVAYKYGVERFAATMKESGFDGLILPDLPPPEAATPDAEPAAEAGSDLLPGEAPAPRPARPSCSSRSAASRWSWSGSKKK